MYTDAQNRPSNAQSLAGVASTTVVSDDSIDLLTANRNIGRGGPMRAIAQVVLDFTVCTSVKADFISSDSGNLSSPTVLTEGPVVARADAVAGKVLLDVPVPDTAQRYVGFQYTTVGTPGAGKVSAHIVAETPRPSTDIFMNTGRE